MNEEFDDYDDEDGNGNLDLMLENSKSKGDAVWGDRHMLQQRHFERSLQNKMSK